MEMKVDIVEFVENEMVELDVVQIGQIDVECGDGCGDGHAKGTSLAGIPFNTKLTSLHPLPNQSKPIVPTPSLSLL